MQPHWTCRDYQFGDEIQILALFKMVFDREMSPAFWNWRFKDSPFGAGIIKLMFDGDRLIGHYAVVPVALQILGQIQKAVFSMTTMTHSEYTGQGIFPVLAEEAYKFCQENSYSFVYGFPNKHSQPGFVHKLKWFVFGRMMVLEKKLDSSIENGLGKDRLPVRKIHRFHENATVLWERVKNNYGIIIPRTEEYLNWRFIENPDINYTIFSVSQDGVNELGYVVLKIYQSPGMVKGHIVDMISIPEKSIIASLLEHSFEYFRKRGVNNISYWTPETSFNYSIMREYGFTEVETDTYFGVRPFSQDDIINRNITQLPKWYITMGDSDVF